MINIKLMLSIIGLILLMYAQNKISKYIKKKLIARNPKLKKIY